MKKYIPSIFSGLFLAFFLLFASGIGAQPAYAAASPFAQTCQATVSSATTTLASCYNSDGTPRIIIQINGWMPQEATTQTLTMGTSTNNSTIAGNTFGVFQMATSSVGVYYATTTAYASDQNRIWAPGTFFNFHLQYLADASTTNANGNGIMQITYLGL